MIIMLYITIECTNQLRRYDSTQVDLIHSVVVRIFSEKMRMKDAKVFTFSSQLMLAGQHNVCLSLISKDFLFKAEA